MLPRRSRLLIGLSLLATAPACRCSRLTAQVDNLEFTRCAQASAPGERELRGEQLVLTIRERVASVDAQPGLRIAAFTGPVGQSFTQADISLLAGVRAGLLLFLGGLGDDAAAASANLLALSSLHVPTLFVAGGADRLPVVEEAFAALSEEAGKLLVQASALRELRIGRDRFAIIAGSPLGRYAIDAQACGFSADDLDDMRDALSGDSVRGARRWLLSWAAPSGWGVSNAAGVDVGSPELFALAQALGARGGVFAYPETQAGLVLQDERRGGLAATVPRLGRSGSTRGDGGRVPSSVALFSIGEQGLREQGADVRGAAREQE
jgi:hypothetical protein